jgi:hypothetical protein
MNEQKQKMIDYIAEQDVNNPGYLFFADEIDINEFDKTWQIKDFDKILFLLSSDEWLNITTIDDLIRFLNQ